MQFGMIGLGRMGASMVQRLLADGHTCVVYARTESTLDELAAVDLGVPAHVLSTALFNRFSSRGEGTYANKDISALRYAFGGHVEKP